MSQAAPLAIVAIGRNEGERLRACLRSLPEQSRTVYVDSGSTDGSVAAARAAGAEVVELPPGTPFTAALARNAGLARLDAEQTPLVQMLDGDCALAPEWLAAGLAALAADPTLAVVFGRRRERFPERSFYNRLCDDEWDVPVGYANACGGDALVRLAAVRAVGGYPDMMIAGEEPDLCLRLRAAGWRIARIDAEMTLHDAAMTRFGQWWRRSVRAGHAFAELAWRNRGRGDPAWFGAVRSSLGWALGVPLAIGLLAAAVGAPALLLALAYPAQVARLAVKERRHGWRFAWGKGALLVISRFSQTLGAAQFVARRLTGATPKLIEYKSGAPRPASPERPRSPARAGEPGADRDVANKQEG